MNQLNFYCELTFLTVIVASIVKMQKPLLKSYFQTVSESERTSDDFEKRVKDVGTKQRDEDVNDSQEIDPISKQELISPKSNSHHINGTEIKCTVCNLEYNSVKYLNYHLAGSYHRDRELEYKIKQKLYCEPCKVQTYSFDYFDRHLNGLKHKCITKALKNNVDLSVLYCKICHKQFYNDNWYDKHVESKMHKLKSDYLDSLQKKPKKRNVKKCDKLQCLLSDNSNVQ